MKSITSNITRHEECQQCEHGRNCINGKYCLLHKMYVMHIEQLPCKTA